MRNVTKHLVFSISLVLTGVVHSVEGYFENVQRPAGFTGSSRLFGAVSVTADGQELYSDDWNNHYDIWVAKLQEDGSWGSSELVTELNTVGMDASPIVSADGLTLIFSRRELPIQRANDADMFMATRNDRMAPWRNVRPLDEINDPVEFEWSAGLSADALSLYFFSDRAVDDFGIRHRGGIFDIFVATRASRLEPFGDVRNIEEVNGPWAEFGGSISSDGLTLFWCDPPIVGAPQRPGTAGWSDVWMATRPARDEPFGPAVNLGLPVNGGLAENQPFVSPDWPAHGSKIYFTRTPNGNAFSLYEATWVADPPRPAFTTTPESGLASLEVRVDASSSTAGEGHSIVSYAWDFGDGTTAQGEITSHTYTDAGRFEIVLTLADERDVVTTKSHSVVVNCSWGDPFPFVAADVGSPAITGGARFDGEGDDACLALCASGKLLAGREDAFHFVCQEFAGNVSLSARVESLDGAEAGAQIGVMLRDSLAPDARCAAMTFGRNPLGGSRFLCNYRDAEAGRMITRDGGPVASLPQAWVRLDRQGDEFVGFASSDGNEWEEVARATIPGFPERFFLGVFGAGVEAGGDAPFEALRGRVCELRISESTKFRRGDANNDGEVDISDGIRIVNRLFVGADPFPCDSAADANDDGQQDVSDAIKVFGFLFFGDAAPPAPGPFACGVDPTDDVLECGSPGDLCL